MTTVKNIFLVDDDLDDQEFFVETINNLENIKLSGIANNGKEALDILKNSASLPDFIFMDYNMPLMNGIECLTEIINGPRTKDINVIMLSSALEQAEQFLSSGAKGFIKKTPDIRIFRTALNKIVNPGLTVNYVITEPGNFVIM